MMRVGLTGGIGSGKSTVAEMFRSLGVPVYDSDSEAKTLMVSSKPLQEAIVELLGKEAYLDEKLNKTYISDMVFKDSQMLQKLNKIVHPAVKQHFLEWSINQDDAYVIQETALIFENNAHTNYDAVILVTAPKNLRLQRVMDRDGVKKEQVFERMKNQFDDSKKIDLADYVIENFDLCLTEKKVYEIHKKLLNESTEV